MAQVQRTRFHLKHHPGNEIPYDAVRDFQVRLNLLGSRWLDCDVGLGDQFNLDLNAFEELIEKVLRECLDRRLVEWRASVASARKSLQPH